MGTLNLFLFLLTFPIIVCSGVSSEVFIQGQVGNEFDDVKVKITDSLDQTYYLEKKYFPKDFVFKQGENFAIEVPEEAIEKIKLIRSKK